jgi:hypothetical protein
VLDIGYEQILDQSVSLFSLIPPDSEFPDVPPVVNADQGNSQNDVQGEQTVASFTGSYFLSNIHRSYINR